MNITYIQHSCFLIETDRFYYLFDYYKGSLPEMDVTKPIFVLSSHGHSDHYNPEIFSVLQAAGMQRIRAVLSDDIAAPEALDVLSVAPGAEYSLGPQQKLTTLRSTDLGVAFLIEDGQDLFYHAGDLNDWVWEGEPDAYNEEMTKNYRMEIACLAQKLGLCPKHALSYGVALTHIFFIIYELNSVVSIIFNYISRRIFGPIVN